MASITSVLWDFGDGTTSTDFNPSHSYAYTGIFYITLTVNDDEGNSASRRWGIIRVHYAGVVGVFYDFDDGTYSAENNPSHSWVSAGTKTVRLYQFDTVVDSEVITVTDDFCLGTETLPRPEYPYETTIDLPFDIEQLDSGKYNLFDWGAIADKRSCVCQFIMTVEQYGNLVDMIKTDLRSQDYDLILHAGCGFFPFGPDKGDSGPFVVSAEMIDREGIGPTPYRYFRVKFRFINTGSWPVYSLPAEVSEGQLQIGGISGCRAPQEWFKPKARYEVDALMKESASVVFTDRGTNADRYSTQLPFVGNESKTAALLNYLLTIRTGAFDLITPEYSYPFDEDNASSGTYSVRLVQNQIKITHHHYNRFTFDLTLSMESAS